MLKDAARLRNAAGVLAAGDTVFSHHHEFTGQHVANVFGAEQVERAGFAREDDRVGSVGMTLSSSRAAPARSTLRTPSHSRRDERDVTNGRIIACIMSTLRAARQLGRWSWKAAVVVPVPNGGTENRRCRPHPSSDVPSMSLGGARLGSGRPNRNL